MIEWRKLFIILLLVTTIILFSCSKSESSKDEDITKRISLAAQLADKGLHAEAAVEYEFVLNLPGISDGKRSNICYLLGNLYYDKQKDYEKALAYYIRAKHYDPESPVLRQITERTVTCLERIGRSLDAQNVLSDATYLAGEETRQFSGKTVAQIGDRIINMGELDNEIQKLPSEQQKQYRNDKEAKLNFLKQYVHNELLYQMAKRSSLHKDPKLRERVEDLEKMLLVQMIYQERVMDKINVEPEDVRLFFKAHKDEYIETETKKNSDGTTGTKTLNITEEELYKKYAPHIMNRLRREKTLQHEAKLLESLMQSENVIIYEGEFK
jgi:tetratricopeptide (TPR) repeat protein